MGVSRFIFNFVEDKLHLGKAYLKTWHNDKKTMTRNKKTIMGLALALALMAVLSLFVGAVPLAPADVLTTLFGGETSDTLRFIVLESRLPQTLTAALCGAALAVGGLLLQNIFRNPLADPSVFGISSGAALGVAVVMLMGGGAVMTDSLVGMGATVVAAFIGAMAVTALVFVLSLAVRGGVALLIIGLMIGYVASAFITVINFFATADGVKSYLLWGMGSFANVSSEQLWWIAVPVGVGLFVALLLSKSLDIMRLGDNYAAALGLNIAAVRNGALVLVGFLTAVTTAFCGPIAFIGLAVPHIARMVMRTDSHLSLVPATLLMGAVIAMACNMACSLPGGGGVLPINAVTPLVGAPIVIYVIMKKNK